MFSRSILASKSLFIGISFLFFFLNGSIQAQPGFLRIDTFRVFKNSTQLKNPWAGGHNFCQFSDIDLDFDGIKDLVVFDRTSNVPYDKLTCYINIGTPNQVAYVHAPQYEKKFPYLHDWMLLVDYNCDGKEDIFTYNVGDFSVYKNTSSGNNLSFALEQLHDSTNYIPHNALSPQRLYVSPVDIPAFEDIDRDGDIDVVTYQISGTQIEYHKNLSMENFGNCDKLVFWQDAQCWGHITENTANNGINLNACTGRIDNSGGDQKYIENPTPQHSGSCLVCLDMDGDRDKDAVIGDVSFCNINMVRNGGDTTLAVIDLVDPNFPSNTVSVNQELFPCPYHVDVNNDGKRDLLFSPNVANVSENISSIIWYENTGTDIAPIFNYAQNDFLQDDEVDVGEGAYPVFFDYDADGLTDLLIGNFNSKTGPGCLGGTQKVSVTSYRNIGTAVDPVFQFSSSDYAGLQTSLAGIRNYIPTFGDMDGDGDADMVVGDENGKLHWFMNTAGSGNPAVFSQVMPFDMVDNASIGIDVGQFAAPQLFDIDGDTLLDLIVGERSGKIFYFQNTGTATAPVFTLTSNNLGGVDVMSQCCTGYATPFLFKDSGITEMFVGSEQGFIYHYTNIDGNLGGNFIKLDSMLWKTTEIWEGQRIAITCGDLTNDGLMDMVVGNYRGGIAFYKGDLTVGMNSTAAATNESIEIFPNPASHSITIKLTDLELAGASLELFDVLGNKVMERKLNSLATSVEVSTISEGIYVCKVHSGNKLAVKKLIIRK